MNEMRDLGQRYLAALWESARTIDTGEHTATRLGMLVETIAEAEAQLAGLRMHVLHEAKASAALDVVAEVQHSVRTTSGQATSAFNLARDLAGRFPLIADALNQATISLPQAEAIIAGLRKLPTHLSPDEITGCQATIIGMAAEFGPTELRILAAKMYEVIDPAGAEAEEAKRLEAEERAAQRDRYLKLTPDFHGSMLIRGQLPLAEGKWLEEQLAAAEPSIESYREAGYLPLPEVRRADALIRLIQYAANSQDLPARGGDRPHVHITLNYHTLLSGLGRTQVLDGSSGEQLSASQARLLACQARIIPIVLGGASQPLDVGREHRFFTAPIKTALAERDKGCAFPDCSMEPAGTQAHHIIPWWQGGESSLENGVLVCPHHHRIVEPDPNQSQESQWTIHLDRDTGLPWFTPPRHRDPRRRPIQHARHRVEDAVDAEAPPCPEGHPPGFTSSGLATSSQSPAQYKRHRSQSETGSTKAEAPVNPWHNT